LADRTGKEPESFAEVLANITEPENWIHDPSEILDLLREAPSVRGMVYGNFAERRFLDYIRRDPEISGIERDDDHAKTKADRIFTRGGRRFTVQNKSLQTNSIREVGPGRYTAKIQNDASDRRTITLPSGERVETTCYAVGEYDILAVGLHPFTGEWGYAFKKNKDLRRTTSRKYTPEQRQYLLSTLEDITWPLDPSWTTDMTALLGDPDLGLAVEVEDDMTLIQLPDSQRLVIED
jgi:hypothetical protein